MVTFLIKPEQIEQQRGQSVNCARCSHHGDFRKDRQVGWCSKVRRMMSTWHPVLCSEFRKAA